MKGASKSNVQAGKGPGGKTQTSGAKSGFYAAVLSEAAKYSDKAKEAPAPKDDSATREKLQLELKKADAAVAEIEALAHDPEIAQVLVKRKAKRDELRSQLHALRPWKTQLRAAEEHRDKCVRAHTQLSEELHGLKLILQAKQEELLGIAKDVTEAISNVSAIQAKAISEEQVVRSPYSLPATPPGAAPGSPVQWAAGLAVSLSPGDRAKFEHFLKEAGIGKECFVIPEGGGDVEAGDDLMDPAAGSELDADEQSRQDHALAMSLAAGATCSSAADLGALAPFRKALFRRASARVDPYVKAQVHDAGGGGAEDGDEDARSRTYSERTANSRAHTVA